MNRLTVPLIALSLVTGVLATVDVTLKLSDVNCLFGCFDALDLATYKDIPAEAAYYSGYCNSILFRTSLLACIEKYCSVQQQKAGWTEITRYCSLYGEMDLPRTQEIQGEYDAGNVTTVDLLTAAGQTMNSTVIPDQVSFAAGYKTENVWNREMNFHHAFGWSMYILFGSAVLFGMMNRLLAYILSRTQVGSEESARYIDDKRSFLTWVNTAYAKYVATPALLGYRHCQPWGWLMLPTRLQGVLIFVYVLVNLVFCCACYNLFAENLYWPDEEGTQLVRYLADRTAILSFYNLPLLWVLAGRNDLVLWLTGWSFSSANLFHRWVARVTVIQAIIHSAAWTWIERDYLAAEFADQYWACGVFATVCMSLLLPFSITSVRQRWYEIFLLTHIAMALAVLVLLWYHVKIMDGDYNAWIWACVAVWGFDRMIRIVRIVVLSFHGDRDTNAKVTMGEQGLMRIEVTTGFRLKPRPGQYYFLYSTRSITPWENHPFTLASWQHDPVSGRIRLGFLVAPQKGATSRLSRKVARAGGSLETRIMLEGPYGSTHSLEAFNSVLLVAGGSGISAILPYVHTLGGSNKRVTVVWAIRHLAYASDILTTELGAFAQGGEHHALNLYLTDEVKAEVQTLQHSPQSLTTSGFDTESPAQPATTHLTEHEPATRPLAVTMASEPSVSSTKSTKEALNDKVSGTDEGAGTAIRHLAGRPDLHALLDASIAQLVGGERLAVLACGPGGMMDDLRRGVCDVIGEGEGQLGAHRIGYFEDQFGW